MQYFASFEIFDEFNGVPGTYIKSFLISDIVNLNKWQTTHEANLSNLDSFLKTKNTLIQIIMSIQIFVNVCSTMYAKIRAIWAPIMFLTF